VAIKHVLVAVITAVLLTIITTDIVLIVNKSVIINALFVSLIIVEDVIT